MRKSENQQVPFYHICKDAGVLVHRHGHRRQASWIPAAASPSTPRSHRVFQKKVSSCRLLGSDFSSWSQPNRTLSRRPPWATLSSIQVPPIWRGTERGHAYVGNTTPHLCFWVFVSSKALPSFSILVIKFTAGGTVHTGVPVSIIFLQKALFVSIFCFI